MSQPRTTGRRRALGLGPAALVGLLCAWEVCGLARAGSDTGSDEDWSRAADAVRARLAPGELVVFAPGWVDPVGRQHLGDVIPIAMAARMDAARYPVIWELSIRDARAPETAGARLNDRTRYGAVTVSRYQQAPAEVVTDFLAAAPRFEGGGAAVVLTEIGFSPHRCLQLVPRPDSTIRAVFDDVALGRTLVGYVGLADVFTRRDVRDPGRLVVRIDGEVVADTLAGVEDGWLRFEAITAPRVGAQVAFEATAVGPNARDRRICFAAEARR